MNSKRTDGHGDSGGIAIGKRDVDPELPTHVTGVHQGNWPRSLRGTTGVPARNVDDQTASTRSTGINADDRLPIDPRMPRLPPA